jgi:hypothetical protein
MWANIVHATDQNGLVVITQIDPIAVVFTIAEDSLPDVMQRVGRGLKVDAFDRDLRRRIASGTLLTVDNQIDQTTGTVKLKAELPNANMAVFPNQLVHPPLKLATIPQAGDVVPSAAIQRSPKPRSSTSCRPVSRSRMRNVDIERVEGDDTAVKSGVAAGDLVVIDGVDKLQRGTRVTVQSAKPAVDGQRLTSWVLSRPFIIRPIATSLLMVGLTLAGLVAYPSAACLGAAAGGLPDDPGRDVLPGASPDVMTSAVTAPLERQFGQLPGLNQMTSNSAEGASVITLQFFLDLNIDVAEQECRPAINAAGSFLPPNLPNPPIYSKTGRPTPDPDARLSSDSMALSKWERPRRHPSRAEDLAAARRGLVSISGGQKPAVRIQVNPTALFSAA